MIVNNVFVFVIVHRQHSRVLHWSETTASPPGLGGLAAAATAGAAAAAADAAKGAAAGSIASSCSSVVSLPREEVM
jgi:hypothetical protein